jgi:hypothetical protein
VPCGSVWHGDTKRAQGDLLTDRRIDRAIAAIREAHAQLVEAANELEDEAPEAAATVEAVRKEAAALLDLMARFQRAGGQGPS